MKRERKKKSENTAATLRTKEKMGEEDKREGAVNPRRRGGYWRRWRRARQVRLYSRLCTLRPNTGFPC